MAIELTNITVTILQSQWNYKFLMTIADMVVAGGLSYSVNINAIPVPSYNVWGFRRSLDWLQFADPMDASAGIFVYRWIPPALAGGSALSNVIRVFQPRILTASNVGSAQTVLGSHVEIASGTELAGFTLRVAAMGR